DYETIDGSAVGGLDFPVQNASTTISAGNQTGLLQIPTTDDALSEGTENFTLSLSGASGAVVLTPSALATIFDNDVPPDLLVMSATVTEGSVANIEITLTSPAPSDVTFLFSTSNDSATGDTDYSSVNNLAVTIPSGSMGVAVPVTTLPDLLNEIDEQFNVAVSSVSVANPVVISNIVTITDDDVAPNVFISNASSAEGSAIDFVISLSAASGVSTGFDYTITDISANAGIDFSGSSASFTIPAGITLTTLSFGGIGDTTFEGDETFSVSLSNLQWLNPGNLLATGTLLDDESEPFLSVTDLSINEGEMGTISLDLSNATTSEVTVGYQTLNSTALAGSDYTALSGVATFAPGSTTSTLSISSIEDALYEGDETFYVSLSSINGASLLDNLSVITINEDDTPPISYFTVSGVASPNIEGSDNGVVVMACDSLANLKTDFVGTVTFSSNDSTASLPASTSFALSDSGVITLTSGIIFGTPGNHFLRVDDTASAASGSQTGISVLSSDFPVILNQASDQTDPALSAPLEFSITFFASIDEATFTTSDIVQAGTASGITWSIINSGDDQSFTLRANSISNEGTLIPSISAGAVQTSDGRQNLATASTDNSVTYCNLASVQLTAAVTTLPISTNQQIVATGICTNSSTVNITAISTWTSDNSAVIDVNSSGQASAIATGSTLIRANAAAIEGTINLTASNETITSLAVTPTPTAMPVNSDKQFVATATYSDNSSLDVTEAATWSSQNGSLVTINNSSEKGLATALSAGSTTVTAQ
ncbi:MAG: Ig-like domain-containing protein, partial [Bdellovibrionales bacterium]|nr:Ig-like domain-containing protein [Bdellovibrionales bacterium]